MYLTITARIEFLMTGLFLVKAKAAERKDAEAPKTIIVQVDDLLSFRQFSKKSADEAIDVSIHAEVYVVRSLLMTLGVV